VFAGLMKKLHELHDCMNGINKVTAQVATKTPRHQEDTKTQSIGIYDFTPLSERDNSQIFVTLWLNSY